MTVGSPFPASSEDGTLRYSDGPATQVSISIDASPEHVWALVSDVDLPAHFSSEFLGARWVAPDTGPRQGAAFVGRNVHPARGEWETTSFIVEQEPNRSFAWAVTDADNPSAQWRFDLHARDGGTHLTMSMRLGPARSGISPAIEAMPEKEDRILRRRVAEHRTNMQATLAGIKALAES